MIARQFDWVLVHIEANSAPHLLVEFLVHVLRNAENAIFLSHFDLNFFILALFSRVPHHHDLLINRTYELNFLNSHYLSRLIDLTLF